AFQKKSPVGFLEPNSAFAETSTQNIAQAIESFFGSGDRTYTVDIGNFDQEDDADKLARTINTNTRSLRAFVSRFEKGVNDPTYHVYVTQMFTLKEALAARSALLASKVTKEATITQMPGKLPAGTSGWVVLSPSPASSDKDPYFSLSNGE